MVSATESRFNIGEFRAPSWRLATRPAWRGFRYVDRRAAYLAIACRRASLALDVHHNHFLPPMCTGRDEWTARAYCQSILCDIFGLNPLGCHVPDGDVTPLLQVSTLLTRLIAAEVKWLKFRETISGAEFAWGAARTLGETGDVSSQ